MKKKLLIYIYIFDMNLNVSFKIYCRENNFTDQVLNIILSNIENLKTLEEKKTIKNL